MIKIVVYGEPVPQSRPRFARRRNFVTTYDAPKSVAYKNMVKLQAIQQYKNSPLTGALCVDLTVYRYLPKSGSKAAKRRRLNGEERPVVKPDVDNYFKSVTDAVKGILWEDDNQIVDASIHKYYSDRPRVELSVTQI